MGNIGNSSVQFPVKEGMFNILNITTFPIAVHAKVHK